MRIVHYTDRVKSEFIKREGLIYSKKSYGYKHDTGAINQILNKYKPVDLPNFIDRDKCIFFYPEACDSLFSMLSEVTITVDARDLDKSRLFVASFEIAQRIWIDVVEAPYTGEYSGVPIEISAKEYWDSLTQFSIFEEQLNYVDKAIEILYFNEIPSKYLCIEDNKYYG